MQAVHKPPRKFFLNRHGSGSALSATGNRLGRTPDPHRCNTDGLRPPTNRVAACSLQIGFAGADAVPGDLKAPG
ncbi:hypothetical protein [Escherichia coli]|uniref:hypothetical protein n=1 Tax=Escherichia coli TaxID=562 RepID=UPI00143F19EE|nr:hypothetical protein [Escherichia coli]